MVQSDYEQQIARDLDNARRRVENGVAASNFRSSQEGKLVQDWINERVSYLIEKMTGKDPLSDRDYLSHHGAIRELKEFNVMLQAKTTALPSAQEEVNVLNEQQRALSGQEPIQFKSK